jgi:ribonucleoside-diphosphate reductase alpha chain
LLKNHENLIKDESFNPRETAVIEIPQFSGLNSITRQKESSLDLLERIKNTSLKWVKNGHLEGVNTHNVSATISVKPDEWKIVGDWMWENKEYYNGLSVLPHDGGSYVQAPFEEITKEHYEELMSKLCEVDLSLVKEFSDETNLQEQIACSGSSCEL